MRLARSVRSLTVMVSRLKLIRQWGSHCESQTDLRKRSPRVVWRMVEVGNTHQNI